MLNYNTAWLEKSCRRLSKAFEKQLSWKWDDRFETVLAEFSVADKESVQKIIQLQMGDVWNHGNLEKVPDIVQMIIDYFGGMSPGQQLFVSNPDKEDLVLCAWWPWGNGRTISIRLGVFADSLSEEENKELTRLFKGWFDL